MTDRIDRPIPYDASTQTVDDTPNRGMDNKLDDRDIASTQISLVTVDEIIINYISDVIKPSVVDNGTVRAVPVLYGNAERWSTFRKDGVIRDPKTDKAVTPMILMRRISMERGKLSNPSNKYIQAAWETGWNARNGYDKFAVQNGIKPSRQFHAVIIPDYWDMKYEIVVWTEYEEQMSNVISQLQVETDDYWGSRNGYKFRVKVDRFDSQSGIESTSDRIIRTQFNMIVGAYLIPERMIKNFKITPTTSKTYTAKKSIIMIETDGTKK